MEDSRSVQDLLLKYWGGHLAISNYWGGLVPLNVYGGYGPDPHHSSPSVNDFRSEHRCVCKKTNPLFISVLTLNCCFRSKYHYMSHNNGSSSENSHRNPPSYLFRTVHISNFS